MKTPIHLVSKDECYIGSKDCANCMHCLVRFDWRTSTDEAVFCTAPLLDISNKKGEEKCTANGKA